MTTVKVIDQQGSEIGEANLSEDIFAVGVKPEIMHLVVRAQERSQRAGTVGVKNRSRIRGGGKKPWRQKGTGRARAGSVRSPLWKGGAIAHGPKARDYSIKVNKKVKRLALKMALSSRLAEENLCVVDKFDLPEIKTKEFQKIKSDLGLKKALIVLPEEDNKLELSARNIPGITLLTQDKINVRDILRHQQLILTKEAAENIQERLQ
jgi:large subunit ribosomal protein L4